MGFSRDILTTLFRLLVAASLASAHRCEAVAQEAAVAAFKAEPTLATYQAAEDVAGGEWPTIRTDLLEYLSRRH